MLTIHHIERRRSERIVWMMEELGLPYRLVFTPGDIAGSWAAIRDIHPLGLAPTVTDGDELLIESGAILQYIDARYGEGRMQPAADSPDFARHLTWLHFAEGYGAYQVIGEFMVSPFADAAKVSPLAGRVIGGAAKVYGACESALAAKPWFGGDAFTAADIMMHYIIKLARTWKPDVDLAGYPHLAAWVTQVEARPAFVKAMAIATPQA